MHFGQLLATLEHFGPSLTIECVRPSPLDVQRALCMVKPALLDVQRTLCTSAPRWGCQSLYIYWAHGPQIVHFDNLGSLAQKWLQMAPFGQLGQLGPELYKLGSKSSFLAYVQ